MLKKIAVIVIACALVFTVYTKNNQPIFKGYANSFEFYLSSPSSNAKIVRADDNLLFIGKDVYGESFRADVKNFCLEEFLSEFNAEVVAVESIEEGISYYAYSPKIKYRAKVNDKIVNLHVFIGESVTVGAPLIYGSF
jgi:hypothetical protein